MEQDVSRYQDVSNLFSLCILSNSGFDDYATFSKQYGHPNNRTHEETSKFAKQLNNLKQEDFFIYSKMYEKLFSIILRENFQGTGSPQKIFAHARDFVDCLIEIFSNPSEKEKVAERYLLM